MEKIECLRCPELGRKKPNLTGKIIDGVSICGECMVADAKNNRDHIISYAYLVNDKSEGEKEQAQTEKTPRIIKKRG